MNQDFTNLLFFMALSWVIAVSANLGLKKFIFFCKAESNFVWNNTMYIYNLCACWICINFRDVNMNM